MKLTMLVDRMSRVVEKVNFEGQEAQKEEKIGALATSMLHEIGSWDSTNFVGILYLVGP